MNILGLDLGSKMGWCLLWSDGRVDFGEEDWLKLPRRERLMKFGEWLTDKLPLVDAVVFEEVQTSFGSGSWVIFRQEGILTFLCRAKPFFGVNPSTLKGFAVPGKKGTKAAMTEAAKKWLTEKGVDVPDLTDNEADAVCVVAWAVEHLRREK